MHLFSPWHSSSKLGFAYLAYRKRSFLVFNMNYHKFIVNLINRSACRSFIKILLPKIGRGDFSRNKVAIVCVRYAHLYEVNELISKQVNELIAPL